MKEAYYKIIKFILKYQLIGYHWKIIILLFKKLIMIANLEYKISLQYMLIDNIDGNNLILSLFLK